MSMLKKLKAARKDAPHVIECLNLCPKPSSAGDVLVPVGAPKIVSTDDWQPLGMTNNTLLIYKDYILAAVTNGKCCEIATLPSAPLCMHTSQQYVHIMTNAGQYLLRHNTDGTFTDIGLTPDFSDIAITADLVDTYTSTIEACSTDKITSAVCTAYREIIDSARLAGAFVQPVVARCRLLDSSGNVVHITQPTTVMLPGGAPLIDAWQFGSDDGGATVLAQTVSADAYRLRVTIGKAIPTAWQNIVQILEVQITPQFHPVDFSGTATVNIGRASATDKFVRVTLPGAERGLSSVRPIASAELLKRAIERFDNIATTVARINNPYDGSMDTIISVASPCDVSDEADDLASALAKSAPEQVSVNLARLLPPHRFYAESVSQNGEAVAWANITPQRFGGYGAIAYAATFEAKQYSGFISIDFANGERVVTTISGDYAPKTLCPLICYPSAEATTITIAINVNGEDSMRYITVPLTADATGKYAFYVSPTLAPFAMQSGTIATPSIITKGIKLSGYVAVSTDAIVPEVKAACCVADQVTTILAARSGNSAWEYKRARFYTFCNDGIKLLTTNSALNECAINLIDRRSVANRFCASDGGNVVYALCDSELLQVSATNVKSIAHNVSGDRVAWIAAQNEVIVANTDDNEATHFCLDYNADSYSSTLVARGPWLDVGGRAFAVAEEGLVELSDRSIAASTPVRWTAWLSTNIKRLPHAVCWAIKASQFTGYLNVDRAWLTSVSPTPLHISRLKVNGAIKSPIVAPLHGHRSIDLQLDLEASVSADFALTQSEQIF